MSSYKVDTFQLSVIFQKLAVNKKPLSVSSIMTTSSLNNALITSSVTPVRSQFFSTQLPLTFKNAKKVKEVEELVSFFRDQTLDSPQLTLLHKSLKAARLAMVYRIVLNRTNTELLAANRRKKQQAKRTGIQYNGRGARVLSLENVKESRRWAENKKEEKEAKEQARRAKRDKQYLAHVSKDLMRLGPDLFREYIHPKGF